MAPLVTDGVLVTGISGGEYGIHGFIDGWDMETGESLWRTYTDLERRRRRCVDHGGGESSWTDPVKIPRWAGVMSTGGGIVFTGRQTGEFEAFDAASGEASPRIPAPPFSGRWRPVASMPRS